MKKVCSFLLTLSLLLFLCGGVQATNLFPSPPFQEATQEGFELANFLTWLVGNGNWTTAGSMPTGGYYATGIGYEAGWDNGFLINGTEKFTAADPSVIGSSGLLVSNWVTVGQDTLQFRSAGDPAFGFSETLSSFSGTATNDIWLWKLLVAPSDPRFSWLQGGDFIAGFDDEFRVASNVFDNHDDLIVAFSQSPVPIPAPVLLLGVGLLGMMGVRRKILA